MILPPLVFPEPNTSNKVQGIWPLYENRMKGLQVMDTLAYLLRTSVTKKRVWVHWQLTLKETYLIGER